MRFSLIALLFMTGCSTMFAQPGEVAQMFDSPAQQPTLKMMDTKNRDHSQFVLDEARCGVVNGDVPYRYQQLYVACMDKLGYQLLTETK